VGAPNLGYRSKDMPEGHLHPGRATRGRGAAIDLYGKLSDASPVPTAVVGADATVRRWNAAAERLFGWSAAEMLGRRIPLATPERLVEWADSAGRVDTLRVTRDGAEVDVALSASAVRDARGRVVQVLVVFEDRADGQRRALELSEARYRSLAEAIGSVIWRSGADGEVVEAIRWTELTGQTPEQYRGLGWLEMVHPDDRDRVAGLWRRVVATPGVIEVESRVRRRDGVHRWISVKGVPVFDDAGRVQEWIGTATDVDRERRAAEALRASEERFRRVVESNMIGLVFWRDSGEITEANDAMCALLGWSRDDLRAGRLRWQDVMAPEHLHRADAALDEILAGGVCASYEAELVRPDGTRVAVLCAGASLEMPHAGTGVSWVIDISHRKRVERELLESMEVVEAVNRIGRQLAAELDLEKLVQAVTDAATQLTGAQFGAFFYQVADERGGAFTLYTLSGASRDAFSHFPLPRNTAIFDPTFRGEGALRLADVTADPRYGRNPPYHGMPVGHLPVRSYLAVPVVSRSGEVLGGLFFGHSQAGVFLERHERIAVGLAAQAAVAIDNARLYETAHRARQAAESASRTKDEFLSVVSHELRTPLAAMTNWLRVLRNDPGDRAARAIEALDRAARTQSKLVDDLLDVSRIVTGRLRLEPRRIDLAAVVRATVEAITPTSDAKGVRIVADRLEPVLVAGDPDRLQQVAWNLLANAVKFTPGGGTVEVAVDAREREARIVVRDSGRGIAPEFLPYVFDRFRQEDPAATRRLGGLGLGLAIVRHLVELHGGAVGAESAGEGRGATFVVTLPLAAAGVPAGDAA
jgi:PAS domain S-box-containing protein